MSNAYRIHGARFLRKYSAADRSSIYSYMADVRTIANTLCKVPWTRVKADIPATTTIHTEEGLDWNEPERDRFDAAEWCGEHSDGFHRAFAQAACYVFKLPTSAIGMGIEKLRIQVTGDAYNPYGARISAMTSATLDIPMDCATVREGEVFRAPDAGGMGAAPRLFLRNKDGSQQWYSNTELVELTPQTPLTAKQYLFVFVCLENYNRGRDGWIEGSSYIDNDVELTLSAKVQDFDEGELNDCSGISGPETLQLVNLENSQIDGQVHLSGPVYSMCELYVGDTTDGRVAVITGDFDEYSIPGFPGFVVWDYDSRRIVSVSERAGNEIPDSLKQAIRDKRVRAYTNVINGISFVFDYYPSSGLADMRIGLEKENGGFVATACSSDYALDDSKVKNELMMNLGDSKFAVVSNSSVEVNGGKSIVLGKSGEVSHVVGGVESMCGILVSGKNTIGGCNSAAKVVMKNGDVLDFGIDLTPDRFESFKVVDMIGLFGYGGGNQSVQLTGLCFEGGRPPLIHSGTDYERRLPVSGGKLMNNYMFYNFSSNSADDVARYSWKVVEKDGYSGFCVYTGKSGGEYRFRLIIGADGFSGLWDAFGFDISVKKVFAITGEFASVGGVAADGAMIVVISESHGNVDGVIEYHVGTQIIPLKIGSVKNMCLFTNSDSLLPLGLSHALVQYS